jgi:Uma2 family endonuclease
MTSILAEADKVAVPSGLMTTEEFLSLPDNGTDRELIRGVPREKPMTVRNRKHTKSAAHFGFVLLSWLRQQPEPRGEVHVGEAGVRLFQDPDTTVGIDVAYFAPEVVQKTAEGARFIDGPPVLAVEILSPSDQQEEILDKVRDYLQAGVKLVWVAEPVFRTVMVYRPDAPPQSFNDTEEISGEPHLPGFRAPVSSLFGL